MISPHIQKSRGIWVLAISLALAVSGALAQPPLDAGAGSPSTATLAGAPAPPLDEPVRELRFNFQGAPVQTVLEYLSRAAGFVIVKTVDVPGTVNIEAHRPVTPEEAVALLDTVLKEQGYAAIRSGRTLTVVRRSEAPMLDLPVRQGNDPAALQRSDQMITQIIPVRRASAKEMVENLSQLLPSGAIISANEKSNAIVLTDSEKNVRRIVEIVRALDQSISEISALRVFPLKHADAKDTAEMIEKIFKTTQSSSRNADTQRQFLPPFMRGGRGEQETQSSGSGASAALQASSTVTAVADERTNAVVVSAPDELMPTIESLIEQVDQSADVLTEVRVFPLQYADAEKLAEVVTSVFNGTTGSSNASRTQTSTFRQRFFRPMGMMAPPGAASGNSRAGSANNDLSSRQQAAATITAVADTRTNSLVVSAVPDTMEQVRQVIEQLDKDPAKTKRVYTFTIQNADTEEVADILKSMFGESGSSTSSATRSTQTGATRTTQTGARTSTGSRSSSSGSSR